MTMAGIGPKERQPWRCTGIYWGLVFGLFLAAAVVAWAIQNSQQVNVKYLVWHGRASLAVVLLGTVVLTVVLTTVTGVASTGSRNKTNSRGCAPLPRVQRQTQPRCRLL